MSICRWSSDDHTCDMYVFVSDRGFETHVAKRRVVWHVELPPPVTLPVGEAHSQARSDWAHAIVERGRAVGELMDDDENWHYLELPEPEGGDYFVHATAAECQANLRRLAAQGFSVPQHAIEALEERDADPAPSPREPETEREVGA